MVGAARSGGMTRCKGGEWWSRPRGAALQTRVARTRRAGPARYSVAAVDRALDLMEALARIGPATLATVSAEAGCTRTAGFRLLRTMEARGFAIQDGAGGSWRLGARLGGVGRAAAAQGGLQAVALPIMTALGKAQGEAVYLRVRDGLESETVAVYRPDGALRVYSEPGHRRPLHAGPGRLLLAHAPDHVQRHAVSQRLARFTASTRTDADWILSDMRRALARGWLVTTEEVEVGAVSIAAPVRDVGDQVVAVIFIAAPSLRMRPPRPRSLVGPVVETAARLSAALGATIPSEPAAAGSAATAAPPTRAARASLPPMTPSAQLQPRRSAEV